MRTSLLILISVVCASSVAAAPVYSPYGVNAHLPNEQQVMAAAQAGVGWLRFDFNWFQMETQRGMYDFSVQDASVDWAVTAGINVFVTLAYTPQWAAADMNCIPGDTCNGRPFSNVADWTNYVTAVVAHFKGRVKVYGMWNEPNLGGFYSGTQMQYVDQILVPGSAAVHAECADCLVAGPETSGLTQSSTWNGSNGTCAFGQCIRNGWELDLGGVLDAAADSIDIVTQHFYDGQAQDVAQGHLADGSFFGNVMTHDSLRGVLAAHNVTGKPVWLTETGIEAVMPSEEQAQADFVTQLLDARTALAAGTYAPAMAANQPFVVEKIFFYDLIGDRGYGLLHDDGTPKLAMTALGQYISAHPPVAPGASSSVSSSSSSSSSASAASTTTSSSSSSSAAVSSTSSSSGAISSSATISSSAATSSAATSGASSVGAASSSSSSADAAQSSSTGEGSPATGCTDAGTQGRTPWLALLLVGWLLCRRKRTA